MSAAKQKYLIVIPGVVLLVVGSFAGGFVLRPSLLRSMEGDLGVSDEDLSPGDRMDLIEKGTQQARGFRMHERKNGNDLTIQKNAQAVEEQLTYYRRNGRLTPPPQMIQAILLHRTKEGKTRDFAIVRFFGPCRDVRTVVVSGKTADGEIVNISYKMPWPEDCKYGSFVGSYAFGVAPQSFEMIRKKYPCRLADNEYHIAVAYPPGDLYSRPVLPLPELDDRIVGVEDSHGRHSNAVPFQHLNEKIDEREEEGQLSKESP